MGSYTCATCNEQIIEGDVIVGTTHYDLSQAEYLYFHGKDVPFDSLDTLVDIAGKRIK